MAPGVWPGKTMTSLLWYAVLFLKAECSSGLAQIGYGCAPSDGFNPIKAFWLSSSGRSGSWAYGIRDDTPVICLIQYLPPPLILSEF